ncbi:MAG TPA: CDP-diacylglycerol--serine O-phosphatidyltransferase, partial [Thermoanaerobaculia bacterium]|nr:CDP-diacylglycerol--serine O-phosphatidyltransferase [Thermoanaerobaculia bacterium]
MNVDRELDIEAPARRSRVPARLQRGAYLLPSLFTVGNILLGFYAIVLGLRSAGLLAGVPAGFAAPPNHFATAALMVFCAGILDGLDGRLARLIGTESDFGKQYDSLADVFTFGVAPALLTYLWGLHEWGRVGWLVPFFYLVCCTTRLARFNVQHKVVDSRFFVGLPAPAAAASICSILFFAPSSSAPISDDWKTWTQVLVLCALLLIGVLMVSTFRYPSGKKFDLRKRWSFRALIPIAAIVLVVYYIPRAIFLTIAMLYTLYPVVLWLIGRLRGANRPDDTPPPPAPRFDD